MSDAPITIELRSAADGSTVAIATLNSPGSLNALSQAMVDILLPQLRAWQDDDSIACVVLRGSGEKAFCAGGDVVALRNSAVANDGAAAKFFEEEYRLDYLIHTYRKPIIAWGHGIVMGGGLGLLSGASHRVVTAKTRLAMPEVTIGLYPDVGGSWFLNKMPGRTGLFIGLTGVSLNAGDTLYLGLADAFLANEQYDAVVDALCAESWNQQHHPEAVVSAILRSFAADAGEIPASGVRAHYDVIQQLTSAPTLAEIVADITAYDGDDKWMVSAAQTLANGCPTAIHVIYEQLRRCVHLSLREAFQAELVLSSNCMRFGNFAEGVRALLVDKDRNPQFDPARFEDVSEAYIEQHFTPPWDGANPLQDL